MMSPDKDHSQLAFCPQVPRLNQARFSAQRDVQVLGGNNIVNYGHVTITSQDDHDTRELFSHTITDAIHTSETISGQDMCLCGTREPTLQRLTNHITSMNPTDRDILWFEGPAGSGKSAVMRSLANFTYSPVQIALASFFFYRADDRRNTIRDFIPTLAYQMSCAIPSTIPFIAAAIRRNRTILTQNAKLQGQALLEEPLIAAASTHGAHHDAEFPSFVILVDGLDECGEQVKQVEIIETLTSFAKAVRERSNIQVKIIIASRPEFTIRHRFKGLEESGVSARLTLHPHDAELSLYYEAEFAKIRETYGLPESWPSPSQKQQLLRRTSGQYAFAATATKYTASGDPEGRLEMVLNAVSEDDENPFATLDHLYALVFKQIPSTMRIRALDVIGSVLIKDGLSTPNALMTFLNIPENFIQQLARNYISSLFRFPDDPTKAISPYHASCADFLFDESRSGRFGLFVSEERIKDLIAKAVVSSLPSRPRTERDWEVLSDMSPYTKITGVSNGSALHPSFLDLDMTSLDIWSFILLRPYCYHTIDNPGPTVTRSSPIQAEIQRRTSEYARHDMQEPLSLFYLYLVALESDPRLPSKSLLKAHMGQICDVRRDVDRLAWNLQDTTSWFRALDLRTGAADILFCESSLRTQGWAVLTCAWCIRHALHALVENKGSWEKNIFLGAGVHSNSQDRFANEIRFALLSLALERKLHQEKVPDTIEQELSNQFIIDVFRSTNGDSFAVSDRRFMTALTQLFTTKMVDCLLPLTAARFRMIARECTKPGALSHQEIKYIYTTTDLFDDFQTTFEGNRPNTGSSSNRVVSAPSSPGEHSGGEMKLDLHFCQECYRSFSELGEFDKHMDSHPKKPRFPCGYPGCSRTFFLAASVEHHMKTHGMRTVPEGLDNIVVERDVMDVQDPEEWYRFMTRIGAHMPSGPVDYPHIMWG